MNRFYRKLFLCCAFFAFSLVAIVHTETVQAASDEVRIQVNDSLIAFPEGQPFIDDSNNLQVPLRLLSEKLGYRVDWSMKEEAVSVTLANQKQSIVLLTGDSQAKVNGNLKKLDSPAQFIQGSVYVPLRFVTETFGYRIQWNAENRIAIVDADNLFHAPAWYAPKPTPSIIQSAFNFLGVPYVWGGSSPSGSDCSGYVDYIFQLQGIQLPRTSLEMFDNIGKDVNNLQEGDLVFFAQGNKTSHVGIYLGNQQFISATNSSGVSVASLTTGYWSKKYVGAKRVL